MFLSGSLFRYTLTAIRRDRIMQLMLVMLALASAISMFLGGAATIEEKQYTLAMAGTSLRLVSILGIIIFISFFIRRLFDSREIDYLLATPLTRQRLLLSFSVAFICMGVMLALAVTGVIAVMAMTVSPGLLIWGASVMV